MKIMMTHSLTFQKSPPETKVFSSVYLQCALETKQNFIVKADRFSQKVPEPAVCMGYERWSKQSKYKSGLYVLRVVCGYSWRPSSVQ